MLKHRGITHSLAAGALTALAAWWLASLVVPDVATAIATGIAIGYLAHVAADACTPSGVALFAPLSSRRRHLVPKPARIPTGSVREAALAVLLTLATLAVLGTLVWN